MTPLTKFLNEKAKLCSPKTLGQVEFTNRTDAIVYLEGKETMPKLIEAIRLATAMIYDLGCDCKTKYKGTCYPCETLKQISGILGVKE